MLIANDLKNKNILIAGGSGLIGQELIKGFLENKSNVINLDLKTNKKLKNITNYCIDLTKINSKNDIKNILSNEEQKIDVFVNCFYPQIPQANVSLKDLMKEDALNVINQHLMSFFSLSTYIAELMEDNKIKGSIINYSSLYTSRIPQLSVYEGTGKNICPIYPIAKSGINQLTKYFAVSFKDKGIRFNSISPSGVENNQSSKIRQHYENRSFMNKMLTAKELVGITIFLASNEASGFITGQDIIVDGGYSLI